MKKNYFFFFFFTLCLWYTQLVNSFLRSSNLYFITTINSVSVVPPAKIPKTDVKVLLSNGEKIPGNDKPNNVVPDPNIASNAIPTTYQYNAPPVYNTNQPGYQPPFSANVPPGNYAAPPPSYPPNYHAPPPPPTNNHGQYYPPPGIPANVVRPSYYPPAGPPP